MKISYNWLKQYLEIDLPAEELAQILTDIGLEVEGTETWESVKGGLEGLVIGKVLTREKHPDADKLSKTTVDLGNGAEPLPIVCGAPNVDAGQTVVVATVGTVLYSGDESFTIKKSKIRGEESQGMICAEDEIGLGHSHHGIMVLPNDVPAGTLAKDYFKVEIDTIFEIGLTPNRIDAASHFGVARDLAAYLKANGQASAKAQLPNVSAFKVDSTNSPITISVENADACPRYCGVSISGVTVTESPDWLKNKLKTIGQNPINNIVDITNYVLHELAQPLHAFDAAHIAGNQVVVKTMPTGTPFVTLDEEERKLTDQDLMICNAQEGMCIAGVFGGIKSGVTKSTTEVFLESAYFDPVWVRKTAKRHTLQTDSSFRFERGVDPNGQLVALKRAALLIQELAGGTITSEIIDTRPEPAKGFELSVSYANIKRLIGKDIGEQTVKTILAALEMEITAEQDGALQLIVPPYRVDVQREADVVEDILRIYGYNNIEILEKVNSTLAYVPKPDTDKLQNKISDMLSATGFNEAMSNSLNKAKYYQAQEEFKPENLVKILNPLSEDLNILRQSLLFGSLEMVAYNANRRSADLKLYEFGNCYYYQSNQGVSKIKDYSEEKHLALVISGNKTPETWNIKQEPTDFFHLKSAVNKVLARLGYVQSQFFVEEINNTVFSYGIKLTLKQNKAIAVEFGAVSKKLLKAYDIDMEVFYADINWDLLMKCFRETVKYSEIPKFQEVRRDLALLLDKQVKFEQIEAIARKAEKKLIQEVSIFDVYQGKGVPEGKKSYAVSFTLQDAEKTLKDKDIDKVMSKLIMSYEKQLGASIR